MSRPPRDLACQTKRCNQPVDEDQALDTLENFGAALCPACAAEAEADRAADRATDDFLDRHANA